MSTKTPDDPIEYTRQTYNLTAGLFVARAAGGDLSRHFNQFAAMAPRGGRVLDIGCGPGRHSMELARRGYRVSGLDLSEGMLAEARRAGMSSLGLADMRRLPVANASVDGLWICASFLHVPHAEADTTLAEFRRVLRAGGVLYLGVKAGQGEQVTHTLGGAATSFCILDG